jgi:pyruvate dehydrogenase E1 component
LLDDLGAQGDVAALIDRRSDQALAELMTNLGGHDLPTLLQAFGTAPIDRPVCFLAYTIKGFGLPLAGHKDNHAGLMTKAQMETFRASMGIREGLEWEPFEGLASPESELRGFLAQVPFNTEGRRRFPGRSGSGTGAPGLRCPRDCLHPVRVRKAAGRHRP